MYNESIQLNFFRRFNELMGLIRNAGMSPYKYAPAATSLRNLLPIFGRIRYDHPVPSEAVRIVLVSREEPAFSAIFDCLLEFHREKLANAPYLGVAFGQVDTSNRDAEKERRTREKVVQTYLTDCAMRGIASNVLLHNLAGFYRDRLDLILKYPEGYEPVSVFALGAQDGCRTLEANHDDSIIEGTASEEVVLAPQWARNFPNDLK